MLSTAHKMINSSSAKLNPQTRKSKGRQKKKAKKAHTSTLRQVKYTYTKKDDLSLEMNTAILESF